MPQRQLTGNRIRAKRIDRGLRQADLAARAGISPSYLNLIEHNRRRIAGRVLQDIARELDVDPSVLTDGAGAGLVERLLFAAADARPDEGAVTQNHPAAEVPSAEEFAGRYPGWASLVGRQSRRISRLEAQVLALNDRLAHDPVLATSLHDVLSSATSIRSTASILVGGQDVDADWQSRFHKNIYQDSQRLAEASRVLVGFLETPEDAMQRPVTPMEEVENWLWTHDWTVASAPSTGEDLTGLGPMARRLAQTWHARFLALIATMPEADLGALIAEGPVDPVALAQQFGVTVADVLLRLSVMPSVRDKQGAGVAVCDGAGVLTLLKPIPGFTLPRAGGACPYWPIFQALAHPGQAIHRTVTLPGDPAQSFECFAVADRRLGNRFDDGVIVESVMLVLPFVGPSPGSPLAAGPGCRICPRSECAARREPSVLA